MKRSHHLLLRSLSTAPGPCRQCQTRLFNSTRILHQDPSTKLEQILPDTPKPLLTPNRSVGHVKLPKDFKPEPLGAPIGLPYPPRISQDLNKRNRGGSMLDRNLAEREKLTKQFSKSYFQDFANLGVHNGKFYLANERLFKKSVALYFPTLSGTRVVKADTQRSAKGLAMGGKGNTTEVLEGKISVVSLFSRKWGFDQTHTFVSPQHNPELLAAIQQSKGTAQLVEVNFEGQPLYKMMRWLFSTVPSVVKDQTAKDVYFQMDALPQEVKEALWIMNEQVGYVFLVDQECRIRWVACGDAEEVEKAAMVKGLKKLIDESTLDSQNAGFSKVSKKIVNNGNS